jgi:peptidoglycan/LPS O-acetylase OafA/YrhL
MNAIPSVRKPHFDQSLEPQPLPARQARIPQLDGLRGLAVLMVVVYHYGLSVSLPPGFFSRLQGWLLLGAYGVDLFFVLSGFLIGGILLDCKASPRYFRTFYLRRFHRIFPLYYLWLGLYMILALTVFQYLPQSIRAGWSGWRPAVVYGFFAQNLVSKNLQGVSAAWLGPLWSLAVEEQFYLLIPLAVRFLSRRRLVQLLLAALAISPLLRLAFLIRTHGAQYTATPLRADALAMGVLLALALRQPGWPDRIRQNLHWLYAAIAALAVAVLYLAPRALAPAGRWDTPWCFSCMGLLFTAGILLALTRPHGWWSRLCRQTTLRNLGGISYCVYVIHLAVITISQAVVHFLYGSKPVWDLAGVLIAWTITLLLAKISGRYFEGPLLRRGHAYKF